VTDGRTGLLVAPGDVAEIGAAVARLVSDGDERRWLCCCLTLRDRFGADAYAASVTASTKNVWVVDRGRLRRAAVA
jgi:hypothetical protein